MKRDSLCFSSAAHRDHKSIVGRLKAKVEPLLTQATVENLSDELHHRNCSWSAVDGLCVRFGGSGQCVRERGRETDRQTDRDRERLSLSLTLITCERARERGGERKREREKDRDLRLGLGLTLTTCAQLSALAVPDPTVHSHAKNLSERVRVRESERERETRLRLTLMTCEPEPHYWCAAVSTRGAGSHGAQVVDGHQHALCGNIVTFITRAASKPQGNNLNHFKDLYLNTKARIWP